jgi:NADPH:quinone reductase
VIVDLLWGAAARERARGRGAPSPRRPPRPAAAPEATLASAAVRGKQIDLLVFSNFGLSMDELSRGYLELLEHAAAGRVRLPVETFALDRVTEAWEQQTAGPGGKVVVRV